MKTKISQIRADIEAQLKIGIDMAEFKRLREKYLSNKAGEIPNLMKEMRNVPKEEKPEMGKIINELKTWAEARFDEIDDILKKAELAEKNAKESVDVTMPAVKSETGSLHPTTLVRAEIINIFANMGFEIFDGPEIETDYYNFTALNVPEDHPARAEQDTFYITDKILLRTQTSPGQIRTMEAKKPPIKVLSPGRVFRSDYDATHSPMFHQMEGLVVDKNISVCDLYGMLDLLAKEIFSSDTKTRLRPSFFPFTEPSVEVDVTCCECGGKGCRLCKGTGWIEVLGGGIVHRKVLENCGVDPEEYSGLAFGIGIDRITMLKYGINNIHILFDNDIRTLKQFKQQCR